MSRLAFTRFHLVDGCGSSTPDMTVLVQDGQIERVGPSDQVEFDRPSYDEIKGGFLVAAGADQLPRSPHGQRPGASPGLRRCVAARFHWAAAGLSSPGVRQERPSAVSPTSYNGCVRSGFPLLWNVPRR